MEIMREFFREGVKGETSIVVLLWSWQDMENFSEDIFNNMLEL